MTTTATTITPFPSVPTEEEDIPRVPAKATKSSPLLEEAHFTDVGNAERLVQCHGEDLRHCSPLGGWLIWDERRWTRDTTGGVIRRAKKTVQAMYLEAHETTAPRQRKELAEHAISSESVSRIRAMVTLAESELPSVPEEFDTNPWLLNVENGTLDLQTSELRPHNRAEMMTKIAPVRFDPAATCPQWDAFLERILPDPQVRGFIKRAVGSSLTGIARDKAMFIFWGGGDNGKTVFIETFLDLLGDYAINTPVDTFLTKNSSGIPNDIARLRGARFVSAQESEQGRRLNESQVKAMTGGDTMTGRFLHHEYFDFRPEFKPFLSTNHKPIIRGTDDGIWNRVKLIPFTVTIPKAEQDRSLRDKLKAELPGILNWALEGCREWQERGLDEPQVICGATDAYRQEMDHVKDFLGDCCNIGDDQKALLKAVYDAYRRWCESSGEEAMRKKVFGAQIRERGFDVRKATGNQTFVFGLSLQPVSGVT